MADSLPEEFLNLLRSITAKRPRIVVEHILRYGFITTEELETLYGYKHPPRAARDVREWGVPLETFRVKNAEGRSIAAYRFGDLAQIDRGKLGGRRTFSKDFRDELLSRTQNHCSICNEVYESRYFQIDHRIPYEVIGELATLQPDLNEFMPLCGSCNRAKSWTCEHCQNWQVIKDPAICRVCYWASPEVYEHVAMRPIRRLDLTWSEAEVNAFDALQQQAQPSGQTLQDFIKTILARFLKDSAE